MLHARLHKTPYMFFGYTPMVDEEWDDFQLPPLTLATCFAQFEGGGRNDFGPAIAPWRKSSPAYEPPAYEPAARRAQILQKLDSITRPSPKPPEPKKIYRALHIFCWVCGWRQGGPDSFDGAACKCGKVGPLLCSPSGDFFYGV